MPGDYLNIRHHHAMGMPPLHPAKDFHGSDTGRAAAPFSRRDADFPDDMLGRMERDGMRDGDALPADEQRYRRRADAIQVQVAKRQVAAGLEALHRMSQGAPNDSPAPGYNEGKKVRLRQPHDLNSSFRQFLAHPAQPTRSFSDTPMRPRANMDGVQSAGKTISYSMHEIVSADRRNRQIIITIDGPPHGQQDMETAGAGLFKKIGNSLGRLGESAKAALGAHSEMTEFGRIFGDWASQLQQSDRNVRITFQGRGLGAIAASTAFHKSIEYGQPVKLNLFDPPRVPGPENPAGFRRGAAKIGGMPAVRALAATFRTANSEEKAFGHLPGASTLMKLSDAKTDPLAFSTVYDYHEPLGAPADRPPAHDIAQGFQERVPGRHGKPTRIAAAYLEQCMKANKVMAQHAHPRHGAHPRHRMPVEPGPGMYGMRARRL